MNIATIKVSGVKAVTNDYPTIPAGIVGATVTFEFTDPAWDGLNKTAVFRGCVTRDVLMTGNVVRIPAETVAQACPFLFVGVYGTDAADNLVIPTLWLSLGTVRDAADPSGDPGTDPGLPVWAQLQDRVEALETGAPSDPDSPGTPGRPGEDGGYYTPAVTQPSSDTVEFAFSPSKPDMPAVDPVQVKLPSAPDSGGNVDLTGYATEEWVQEGYQPKGDYLTDTQLDPVRKSANEANAKVDTLRGVVSKFHSNIVEEVKGDIITLDDASDLELAGLRVFGKTVVLNQIAQLLAPSSRAGVTITKNADNFSTIANGTATSNFNADGWYGFGNSYDGFYSGHKYLCAFLHLGGTITGTGAFTVWGNKIDAGSSAVITLPASTNISSNLRFDAGTVLENFEFAIQCIDLTKMFGEEIASTITTPEQAYALGVPREHIPYNLGEFVSVGDDGSVTVKVGISEIDENPQTLTVQKPANVPVFLPGFRVTSGGNHTDENGQQWICDEVDFASGKYAQRVGRIDSYSGEDVTGAYISTTGDLSEGATVLYELTDHIEHNLSAEELAQYTALHTNYPNTTIFNDVGADMEVKYVADTKLYIDKKFAELSTALLNQ